MRRAASTVCAVLALTGCATFSPDGGLDRVSELTRERVGQAPALQRSADEVDRVSARVDALLGRGPLEAESAVELAFLNNRGLQAALSNLSIAEADLVRAGRLANPSFAFGRLREAGGVVEIERSVLFNVLNLLTLPLASDLERQRFEQVQLSAAQDAVVLAAEVRRAYVVALAAQELVRYRQQVREAADASNELARRMVQAGNFPKLTQMREQAFYADATAELARAQHRATADRERLVRLLGLSGAQSAAVTLPERLPDLPNAPDESRGAEQRALAQRLDVRLARHAAAQTARSLGLTRATRFINVLELGYQNQSVSGQPRANGYEIELELPLFDFGSTRARRAEAIYMQALHRAAQAGVNAQSEVRESYSAYRTAYDLARHYRDEVVPLKKRISEENLLRYNGMLISVFELLADARAQIAGVTGYVEALRDFWIADADLKNAISGGSPGGRAPAANPSPVAGSSADGAAH